jgi:hypothetical protein
LVYRISVKGECSVATDRLREHVAFSRSLNLPEVSQSGPKGKLLAIVGGGQSAKDNLEVLRSWPGDIWAINGTCVWLKEQGVRSVFVTVDPQQAIAKIAAQADSALVASVCHPDVFKVLAGKCQVFHTEHADVVDPILGGSTTAMRTPLLAVRMGYADVVYFGCEGSFADTTHVFKDESALFPAQVIIRANGQEFRTNLQFMDQSEGLAQLITAMPEIYSERSGGLLRAMIEDPEWEVVALSRDLKRALDPDDTNPTPYPYS